jgi:hypothetical protein
MIRVILRVSPRWYVFRVCGHIQYSTKARQIGELVRCHQCAGRWVKR